MAKILVASVSMDGHVNPMIPIVKKLLALGHQVGWYAGDNYCAKIEAAGATFFMMSHEISETQNKVKISFDGKTKIGLLRQGKYYLKHVLYNVMMPQFEELKLINKEFKAEIIVTDDLFTGAIPFKFHYNVPWVIYSNTPLMLLSKDTAAPGSDLFPAKNIFQKKQNLFTNWLIKNILFFDTNLYISRLMQKNGLPTNSYFILEKCLRQCDVFLQFATLQFEFYRSDLPKQIKYVGPLILAKEIVNFDWWNRLQSNKKVIFVTQGTMSNGNDLNQLIVPTVEALKDEDYLIIASSSGFDTSELKKRFPSENIIFEKFVPYANILPHVDLMITNGGYGGVTMALNYGVPIVVAGVSEDKPDVGTRVEYFKVGINLKTANPTLKQIIKATKQILNDSKYAENAKRISADFQKHNAVDESVSIIEQFVNKDKI